MFTGNRRYYLYNGHGYVEQLTDANGNVIKEYKYDSFGNELEPDTNDTNPSRYAGEYFDKEIGMYYLRARYFDQRIGRFITEDSYEGQVIDPLSLNLYTYCGNNPVMFTDPSGHYYIKRQKDGTYTVIKESLVSIGVKTIACYYIPFGDSVTAKAESIFFEGGTSSTEADSTKTMTNFWLYQGATKLGKKILIITNLSDAAKTAYNGNEIRRYDNIATGLLTNVGLSK